MSTSSGTTGRKTSLTSSFWKIPEPIENILNKFPLYTFKNQQVLSISNKDSKNLYSNRQFKFRLQQCIEDEQQNNNSLLNDNYDMTTIHSSNSIKYSNNNNSNNNSKNMDKVKFQLGVYSITQLNYNPNILITLDPICLYSMLWICIQRGLRLPLINDKNDSVYSNNKSNSANSNSNSNGCVALLSFNSSLDGELPILIEDEYNRSTKRIKRKVRSTTIIKEFGISSILLQKSSNSGSGSGSGSGSSPNTTTNLSQIPPHTPINGSFTSGMTATAAPTVLNSTTTTIATTSASPTNTPHTLRHINSVSSINSLSSTSTYNSMNTNNTTATATTTTNIPKSLTPSKQIIMIQLIDTRLYDCWLVNLLYNLNNEEKLNILSFDLENNINHENNIKNLSSSKSSNNNNFIRSLDLNNILSMLVKRYNFDLRNESIASSFQLELKNIFIKNNTAIELEKNKCINEGLELLKLFEKQLIDMSNTYFFNKPTSNSTNSSNNNNNSNNSTMNNNNTNNNNSANINNGNDTFNSDSSNADISSSSQTTVTPEIPDLFDIKLASYTYCILNGLNKKCEIYNLVKYQCPQLVNHCQSILRIVV
ncbi:hypothetical protein B5S28_g4123 [[Candida] boidinii]|nr:hypothetical protein B5S28_g4123 [[Candida] boidinii]